MKKENTKSTKMNIEPMLKVDYLRNVINHIRRRDNFSWFFLSVHAKECITPEDLLCLPPIYLRKMHDFVTRFTMEELEYMEAKKFIQDSTGECVDKVIKLIKIAKKKQSLEQDFK